MDFQKIRKILSEEKYLAAAAIALILIVILIFLSVQYLESQQLRHEMVESQNRSYFVTNITCGYGVNKSGNPVYRSCPENLRGCFEVENFDSPRCVKEGYTRNYCGNHSTSMVLQSRPADMRCMFQESFVDQIKPVTYRIGEFFEQIEHQVSFLQYQVYQIRSNLARERFSGTFAPNVEIETSYEPGKEVVKISVVNGSFPSYTDDRGGDLILTAENFSGEEKISSNLKIRGYGRKNSNGYWAEYREKFFHISFPGPALTGLPVEENEYVKILSDGTDLDGDGKAGIENGEKIFLYRKEKNYDLIAELKISGNSTKRKFWGITTGPSVGLQEMRAGNSS